MFGKKNPDELHEIPGENLFRLVRKIAEGGMGAVYEAKLSGSDGFEKTVAIKTIKESISADPQFVEMFIGEAKLVADLVHQYIVQIYQLGKFGSMYYMAMEYVQGVNLQEPRSTPQNRPCVDGSKPANEVGASRRGGDYRGRTSVRKRRRVPDLWPIEKPAWVRA